jgi:hypothetical protein
MDADSLFRLLFPAPFEKALSSLFPIRSRGIGSGSMGAALIAEFPR